MPRLDKTNTGQTKTRKKRRPVDPAAILEQPQLSRFSMGSQSKVHRRISSDEGSLDEPDMAAMAIKMTGRNTRSKQQQQQQQKQQQEEKRVNDDKDEDVVGDEDVVEDEERAGNSKGSEACEQDYVPSCTEVQPQSEYLDSNSLPPQTLNRDANQEKIDVVKDIQNQLEFISATLRSTISYLQRILETPEIKSSQNSE